MADDSHQILYTCRLYQVLEIGWHTTPVGMGIPPPLVVGMIMWPFEIFRFCVISQEWLKIDISNFVNWLAIWSTSLIIMWLVQWTLPFPRTTSMPVDFVLEDRQLPDQCSVERHQIQTWKYQPRDNRLPLVGMVMWSIFTHACSAMLACGTSCGPVFVTSFC